MPTLIIDQPDRRYGGRITGRVLIGRLPTNGVPLADSSVSRLHAWVSSNGNGHHFIADTGSLTGTSVNGAPITRRRDLVDGDVIQVGNTRITYFASDDLPAEVQPADLLGQAPIPNVQEGGVLFDCPCGAPIWVKAAAIGHSHPCSQCGRTVLVPDMPGLVARQVTPPTIHEPGVPPATAPHDAFLLHEPGSLDAPPPHDEHGLADSGVHPAVTAGEVDSLEEVLELGPELEISTEGPVDALLDEVAAIEHQTPDSEEEIAPLPEAQEIFDLGGSEMAAEATCSVCHNAIYAGNLQTVCPSCGLTFHEGCWTENLGCSAYGCPQVNALAPVEKQAEEVFEPIPEMGHLPPEEPVGFPWEFMFLMAGVIGTLLGALTYGVPAMVGLLGTLSYVLLLQNSQKRRPIAWIAVVLCLAGIGIGMYISFVYWKGWPPIGPWARGTGMKR